MSTIVLKNLTRFTLKSRLNSPINCVILNFCRNSFKMSDDSGSESSPPSPKKAKLSPGTSSSGASKKVCALIKTLEDERAAVCASIMEFKFNKNRVRILSKAQEVREKCDGIVYWMSRDARVQDNWAFLYAQKLALKNHVPLHVVFCLVPTFLDATMRHFKFMLKGLQEVEEECLRLGIGFHLLMGEHGKMIPKFIVDNNFGALVTDFTPLRVPTGWVESVKSALPKDVPFAQVDAHNIVPVWVTSDKQEYAARTIRNKVNSQLPTYLTKFPPVIKHPHKPIVKTQKVDWKAALKTVKADPAVDEVKWATPGYSGGIEMLESFCEKRLKGFNDKRNDPVSNNLSNLSPWFHFGQIAVQRAILQVNKYKSKYKESVDAFNEEAIVRRELSDNFCFYNKNYDNLKGITSWASTTLNDHRKDKRPYLYTQQELEESKTHDDLWNAAQNQLRQEGKMHGFLRMYWAKKILEWTTNPEEALRIAIYLNDRYNLDGRDPNGYVGCMWSIGGIHDQGWGERAVFGKIRYMNYQGCKRKFDIKAFISRYGGKVYPYNKK
ncbi:deoxyribodipyrimidine photo-lyase-like [Culicoides brevitarsis]|uniref:deoxyribodipyrimidine photo-lyase-like n=1 Tax=Culicoides brevitarsis TaxID=469753 RepID=UPI00307B9133